MFKIVYITNCLKLRYLMSSFANLKKSSGLNIEKLHKAVESMNQTNYNPDEEKYWKPTLDKSGNGYFIIRFLPAPPKDGDDALPWVKYYDHGFQGPTGLWYIEKSLTSLGMQDAISTYNSELWNSGVEANKELARKQKRRLHYVSNIYIIRDSKNPENEGQIKLFNYGKSIFDKILRSMKPEFEDEVACDPFDMWKGANFKFKIRKGDSGFSNYDLSEFDSPSPLSDDDEELEKIWNSEHSLKDIIDPKNFKTPEELKIRLERVLNITSPNVSRNNTSEAVKMQKIEDKEKELGAFTDDESEDMDYFKSLINDE